MTYHICTDCPICGKVHPELQLAAKIRTAISRYEKTAQPTAVFKTPHGYDFTTTSDPSLPSLQLDLLIPDGWIQ